MWLEYKTRSVCDDVGTVSTVVFQPIHNTLSKMTKVQTIKFFINQIEDDLEDLYWQIQEETNFEDNSVDYLSEEYDEKKEHLENLKSILSQL